MHNWGWQPDEVPGCMWCVPPALRGDEWVATYFPAPGFNRDPSEAPEVPEGLISLNLSRDELTELSAICSYYKNTNPYPSQAAQRVAAHVIERNRRGY